MNSLRLFATNAIRANSSTINVVRKQLNQEQIWCVKRAGHSFSAALLIRNTTTEATHKQPDALISSSSRSNRRQNIWGATNCPLSLICCYGQSPTRGFGTKSSPDRANKSDTKSAAAAVTENEIFGDTSKLGLFAKFKLMYKMYWYVLIPVHVVTSAGWLGGFYYLSQSGVDVPALLQYLHLSETIIEKFQGSSLGHWAVAYLCYKVATPLRYAVTLGGTTVSIKYLVQQGHIKPMPTKAQFLQMYEDKKAQRAADKASKDKSSSSSQHEQTHEQK